MPKKLKLFDWLTKPFPPLKDWWLGEIIIDESGSPSAKRVMGLASGFALIFALLWNVMNPESKVNNELVSALMWICMGCLGLSTVDKFSPTATIIAEADTKKVQPPEAPVEPTDEVV